MRPGTRPKRQPSQRQVRSVEPEAQVRVERLLEGLSRPEAYPHRADDVRVVQTHLSIVFLAGPYAYKLKKPVHFGFVDFSTPDRRRHFCHEEVRLNSRLAPTVYHGVVPIAAETSGFRIGDVPVQRPRDGSGWPGAAGVVDWLVRMTRLPQERTLKSLLRRGELDGAGGPPSRTVQKSASAGFTSRTYFRVQRPHLRHQPRVREQ